MKRSGEKHIIEKHALWIRWTHWINFPLLTMMIWSGTLIYWANNVYWPRVPDKFYDIFDLSGRLAEGMSYHFLFMWLFALNGVAYVLYMIFSGEWRELVPHFHHFREAGLVFLHDLGIKVKLPQAGKFNAAQKIAYSSIVLMGLGSVITGVAIYKPVQLHWLKNLLGGYDMARKLHFYLTLGYILFFFVHIAQVGRAGWNGFRAMVAGFEIRESDSSK